MSERAHSHLLIRVPSYLIVAVAVAACSSSSDDPPSPPPPQTYTVGGTVDGLLGAVTLQNNGGSNLTVTSDGAYRFPGQLDDNANYSVTILTQPDGQLCAVDQASGVVSGANVTSVAVACRPADPVLSVVGREVKILRFAWADVTGETDYRLMEDITGSGTFNQLASFAADAEEAEIEVFLPDRVGARYTLEACYSGGCSASNVVEASSAIDAATGYVKALEPDIEDGFGGNLTNGFRGPSIAISEDGSILAVGVASDDSSSTGTNGNAADDGALDSGAVYVLSRQGSGDWMTQAYIKASNAADGDFFGAEVALSNDGRVMAVSAPGEDSAATAINGNQADDSETDSGAVYVFELDDAGAWSQLAYIKASNTEAEDGFGLSIDLSGDGRTLAVGAFGEDSNATGLNGDQDNNALDRSGAAYVFRRGISGAWSQQGYFKASNTDDVDVFGYDLALSDNGLTLAVGAPEEDSSSAGINGPQDNDLSRFSGAVYVFVDDGSSAWSQTAYVKASNTGRGDIFGFDLALSGNGRTLAVGAPNEDSAGAGVGAIQFDESELQSGAVYVFNADDLGNWTQQAYIKASNPESSDIFGAAVDLATDGSALIIAAPGEDSNSVSIGGDQVNNLAMESGAAYLFSRDTAGMWRQDHYIKSPNSDAGDFFSGGVALSGDGQTLVVSAPEEDSGSPSGGDRTDNSISNAGAVYVY